MPFIPPEVVAKAREMDLLTYLRNYEPHELVHFGGSTYCTREHDSLKISNGKWCWFSRGIGSTSALDYLIKVKDIPFMEAVERIVGQTAVQPPVFVSAPKQEKPASQIQARKGGLFIMKEKATQKLFGSITNVNDQFVEESRSRAKRKNPAWVRLGAIAACLCLGKD